ncbi:hypothetical protein SAMN05192532_10536 [Alteribacillus iranensis]|uniref:Uncharacterized protein n=1 Tax=Alteribacillus iranensis TaxID=930128 RepID=A0A1I2E125_9BACI|nr:hypothetical protein SAMN05192532_10536 [Alteribacillus iranensis]
MRIKSETYSWQAIIELGMKYPLKFIIGTILAIIKSEERTM